MHRMMLGGPAALLLLAACGAGSALGDDALPTDDAVVSHTDATLAAWWLKPGEKRFDEIGWVDGLTAARKLSEESGRPLFLFTMDGRANTGRC